MTCSTCGFTTPAPGPPWSKVQERDHERLAVGWQCLQCPDCRRWTWWEPPNKIARRALDFIDDGWTKPEWEDLIGDAESCLERAAKIQLFRDGWESAMEEL